MRAAKLVLTTLVVISAQLHAQSGAAIYRRLMSSYPYAKPLMFGFATPVLAWFVPEQEWKRLTVKERGAVVEYMPVLIAKARRNPDPYLDMPSFAPLYQTAIEKVRDFSNDQWEIGVGRPTGSGARRTLTMDTQVVCGANASPRLRWCICGINSRARAPLIGPGS
ncbi:MAG: hypothetical protein ACJ8DC_13440 [Gemmatimonadales bacterium]